MTQAAAETALAPDYIEATLNYIVDDGSKVFTVVASPGGTDARSGGTHDPRRVTIHNGRHHAEDFVLERHRDWSPLRWPADDRAMNRADTSLPSAPVKVSRRFSLASIQFHTAG